MTKKLKYEQLLLDLQQLIDSKQLPMTVYAITAALIKQSFPAFSWVGFYLKDGDKLHLGPFQGKVACTTIQIGQGVCGAAVENKYSIVVDDVSNYPGHIVCDERSNSEIVIPLIDKQDNVIGVLDIDSYRYKNFNDEDRIYLEQVAHIIVKYLK
jgi:L-methionine (R)-S-oxide reductase